MNWNDDIFRLIGMGTFSNIWYWLALAVTWSTVSHWIIGVPFDMINNARRRSGQATQDLEILIDINVRRLLAISDMAGAWIIGFTFFVITGLATTGFYYGLELAQGIFCLVLPLTVVGKMNMSKSRRYAESRPEGEALARDLLRLRFWIQVVAVISIFLTAMYGMYYNVSGLTMF